MTIVVIDGMGGGLGVQIVSGLRRDFGPDIGIVALGTNAVATQRMLEAGADRGASGENAIRVSVGSGDFIIGPIGIALPNAMMGEVSPAIAEAVMAARGRKLLVPLNQPHVSIVGFEQKPLADQLAELFRVLGGLLKRAD